ncbi:MAG: hypothetical protein MUE65_01220, partial [Methanomassiliicoccales archaeon]|nr:hypothetical protein [Methanomassiliicoccales archaeon]
VISVAASTEAGNSRIRISDKAVAMRKVKRIKFNQAKLSSMINASRNDLWPCSLFAPLPQFLWLVI